MKHWVVVVAAACSKAGHPMDPAEQGSTEKDTTYRGLYEL